MIWQTPNRRIATIALSILVMDQLTKFLILTFLPPGHEAVLVNGFFKFVRWGNKGAAWSLFEDSNFLLAAVSAVAMIALWYWRHHFEIRSLTGQISLGLVFGGILGNLLDRLNPFRYEPFRFQVIDFIRFYLYRRNGEEIGFPAFNVADSAICVGVALLVILSWIQESKRQTNG